MSFQTHKTFVHLWKKIKIFLMKSESFRIDSKATDTFKAQKCSKIIDTIVHMTSMV